MTDFAAAYRDVRSRVTAVVRGAGPGRLETVPPATPEWRVKDVLGHLCGVSADIVTGNLEGVATDAWTARQVGARRDWDVERLLAEWQENGAKVDDMIPAFPEFAARQLLTDAATHEQDIRGGLEAPGARDAEALAIGFAWMAQALADSPGVRLETDVGTFGAVDGEPHATVRADRFELFRAMTGRRSLDQMRRYHWEGEPRPEALVMPIFTPRPTPLVE
jgi:uncharacterized protein (TIGR03083 family)